MRILLLLALACGGSSEPAPDPVDVSEGGDEEVTSDPIEAAPAAAGPVWDETRDPNDTPPDVAAVPAYAQSTASGLASHVLRPGDGGARPGPTTTVTVNYAGWTTDGGLFDSSWQRGQPASFPLNRVISGWTEGVQLMTTGEIRRFWIPANLAYGDNPGGGRPGGMLVFDVELISIDN